MKQMALKTYGRIIGALMSVVSFLTGFIACSQNNLVDDATAAYGSPVASYIVKGTVASEAGTPIQNIRVVVPKDGAGQYGDVVYTNANGEYKIEFNASFVQNKTFEIVVSDVDGSANGGLFVADTAKVQFTKLDQIAAEKGWNEGTFQKAGQNFTLKH